MFSPSYFALQAEYAADALRYNLFLNPYIFRSYQWDSDFAHDPSWSVVPLYLNYRWCHDEMHTFNHPLVSLGKGLFVENLNCTALDNFPFALSFLSEFISTSLINYIGVSILPANTILAPHAHQNVGNLKLHASVYSPPSCGLAFSNSSGSSSHQWSAKQTSVYFNDNYLHSAWNYSNKNRFVLIVDFHQSLLSSHPYTA